MTAFSQTSHNMEWDFESGSERREKIRFGIRAFVKFEWVDEQGIAHRERGFTRDMSSKGMFIFSYSTPPAMVDLQAEVFFGGIAGADGNLELNAKGLVLRVESVTKSWASNGFAVLYKSYSLTDQGAIPDMGEDSRNVPN